MFVCLSVCICQDRDRERRKGGERRNKILLLKEGRSQNSDEVLLSGNVRMWYADKRAGVGVALSRKQPLRHWITTGTL